MYITFYMAKIIYIFTVLHANDVITYEITYQILVFFRNTIFYLHWALSSIAVSVFH